LDAELGRYEVASCRWFGLTLDKHIKWINLIQDTPLLSPHAGAYNWSIAPNDGINPSCSVPLTILACPAANLTCKPAPPLSVPATPGNCSGLLLQRDDLYTATGGPVVTTPPLPNATEFWVPVGGSFGPYKVAPRFGSSPPCSIPKLKVAPCAVDANCSDASVNLTAGGCDGVSLAGDGLFRASGPVKVTPKLPTGMFFAAGSKKTYKVKAGARTLCSFTVQVSPCLPACGGQVQLAAAAGACTARLPSAREVLAADSLGAGAAVKVTPGGPFPWGVSAVAVSVKYKGGFATSLACNLTVVPAAACP
jgi:hypothetical protein